ISSFVLFFFFFQAEDVIRDRNVTGVQTCALPIYERRPLAAPTLPELRVDRLDLDRPRIAPERGTRSSSLAPMARTMRLVVTRRRSEERRVGKSVGVGVRRGSVRGRKKVSV